MATDRITLGATLVLTQAALWAAYSQQFKEKSEAYWGEITDTNQKRYYLASAIVAYVLNLGLAIYLIADPDAKPWQRYLYAMATVVYYLLQIFFLPLLSKAVKTGDKTTVRLLLGVCIVPMTACAVVGIWRAVNSPLGFGSIFAGTGAIVPLLHVMINDFYLFGFNF
tara:strand:- start:161 stop:661 length:501 start_codon:yes stop_codon:yes gene_type:complete